MAIKKDIDYMSASDIAVVLTYLLRVGISASNVYIALLQLQLVEKDLWTDEWIPTENGKKLAEERPYRDRKTGENKTFWVWHRDVVEKLVNYFKLNQNEEN